MSRDEPVTRVVPTTVAALEEAAVTDRGFSFLERRDSRVDLPYAVLRDRARALAGVLARWGVEPGDVVGIIGPNTAEWVLWAFATWYRGATVAPIQFGALAGDLGAYVARLRWSAEVVGCRVVVAEARFVPAFDEQLVRPWDVVDGIDVDPAAISLPRPDDTAVLQFTSGTTSDPRVAELPHANVVASVSGMTDALSVGAKDVSFSWLPFFHDNGLFGHMLGPVVSKVDGVILPTERFARNPATWFRLVGETGATLTSGPCSAWAVALKAALKNADGIDLTSLRMGIFGAEAIDPAVIDRFEADGARLGLRPGTLVGAYGLAEATLLVTVGSSGGGMRVDATDSQALAEDGVARPVTGDGHRQRRVVSCGSPQREFRVRIVKDERPLPERETGEIQVAGGGLMRGYRGVDRHEQPLTNDGWLRTGDLGYVADGELFVTGRIKDLIIALGRNYAPEELEWAAQLVTGVRPGRCVAFAAEGGGEGRPVVVFEPAPDADPASTADEVRRSIAAALGLTVADVVAAAKGTIRKTTSGKLQRGLVRDAFLRGEIVPAEASRP